MAIAHRKIIARLVCRIWLLFFMASVSSLGFIISLVIIVKYGIHP